MGVFVKEFDVIDLRMMIFSFIKQALTWGGIVKGKILI